MDYKLTELQSEADVINLIGYDTPMKFNYTSEGVFEFQTLITQVYDNMNLFTYKVEFFIEEGTRPVFFNYDSFGSFLSDYQIHTVSIDYDELGDSQQIYFKGYQTTDEFRQTRLGFFLDKYGIRDRFENNVNKFGELSLSELYNCDMDLQQTISNAFPFTKTPEGENKWLEICELSLKY
jgi:hypothetical protein